MKGALPPSSSATFFTVVAHWAISCLPTAVEPVKENFRTSGFDVNSSPTSRERVVVIDVEHARPACRRARPVRPAPGPRAASRPAGLITKVQPAASAGATLRVIMALGKFHGVIAPTTPIGCLSDEDALAGARGRDHVAIDPLGLLGEPLDEAGAVGHLAAALGQGLALFGGHQPGQVLLIGHDQIEPGSHQRRRVPWRSCRARPGEPDAPPRWPPWCRPHPDRRHWRSSRRSRDWSPRTGRRKRP